MYRILPQSHRSHSINRLRWKEIDRMKNACPLYLSIEITINHSRVNMYNLIIKISNCSLDTHNYFDIWLYSFILFYRVLQSIFLLVSGEEWSTGWCGFPLSSIRRQHFPTVTTYGIYRNPSGTMKHRQRLEEPRLVSLDKRALVQL